MALQSSGQISMSDLAAEFGDTGEYVLSDYYLGGPFVSPAYLENLGVPSSGEIRLSDMYGTALFGTPFP